jgi:hypothetical protein
MMARQFTPTAIDFGVVLLANSGYFFRAAKLLDLGEKAYLLPDEKKLLEMAQLTVARR